MASKKVDFANGQIYHIYNRGVHKTKIFLSNVDYQRWELMLYWYANYNYPLSVYLNRLRLSEKNSANSIDLKQAIEQKYRYSVPLVKILAYVEMPNHYHLVLEQNTDNGIPKYMHKLSTAFTQYFNHIYDMTGSLFQGSYRAIRVKTDEQLYKLILYVLRNPLEAGLVDVKNVIYFWSSMSEYIGQKENLIISKQRLPEYFTNKKELIRAVLNSFDEGKGEVLNEFIEFILE